MAARKRGGKRNFKARQRMEAREIARTYLALQKELGGSDTYAACRIVHPRSGELMGAGSIFVPSEFGL